MTVRKKRIDGIRRDERAWYAPIAARLFKRIRTASLCCNANVNGQKMGCVGKFYTYLMIAAPIGTLTASTQPIMPPPYLLSLFWILARRRRRSKDGL